MFEELIDDQIKEFNDGLEEVIKLVDNTKRNIENCLNSPNYESDLQENGAEFIQLVVESKDIVDSYYGELTAILNDEEALEGMTYFKNKYGDIEEKIKYCVKTIDELNELTNKIMESYKNIVTSKDNDLNYKTKSRILDL